MKPLENWARLTVMAGALFATSVAWADDEKLPDLKDVPHVAQGSGARPAEMRKLPTSRPPATSTSKPGDAARKVLAHNTKAKPSSSPTLIAQKSNAWASRDSATGQQLTGTLFSGDGTAVMDSNGTTLIFMPTGTSSTPTGTLYQNVTLAPGQQYLVEVAMRTDCASGQLTMTSQNAQSQQSVPISGPSETNDVHLLFQYTYVKGLQNINIDQVQFTVTTNTYCNGFFLDAIACVPFTPAD